jgi:acetyltransferase-like isoleucine patch superfamily enzyme
MNALRDAFRRLRGKGKDRPFYTADSLKDLIGKGAARVGEHSYGSPTVKWWGEDARLVIGTFCSIAEGVTIYLGGNHRIDWVSTYPFPALARRGWAQAADLPGHPATKGDVVIGNDVWIASGSVILSGAHIGDGAVIAANTVVSKPVPPYAVWAGNPGRLVRMRFDDATVARLLAARWWDWPKERIEAHLHLLCSPDVGAFLDALANDGHD